MGKKTFQEFLEESAIARGALKLLRAASRAGKVTRTVDGGRRVTSAARASRTSTPRAMMTRAERGETWKDVGDKIDFAAKIRSNPSMNTRYKTMTSWDRSNTIISGNKPKDKNITIARSAAQKAGFKGGGAKNRVDFQKPTSYHSTYPKDKYPEGFKHPKSNTQVDTDINTIPSGRKAAALSSSTKLPRPVTGTSYREHKRRVPSTDKIVARMKEFRRRVVTSGGDTRKPAHMVDFIPRRDDYGVKGELDKYSMKVGRNFMKAQKNLPKELEKAGAKKGDIVIGGPSHMRSGENPKLGREKRAKMYQKTFGNRVKGLDPTGRVKYMIGAVGGDVPKK